MTVLTTTTPTSPARASHPRAVLALARLEAGRMLRHPLVALGLAASVWLVLTSDPAAESYPGDTYMTTMVLLVPMLAAVSFVTAVAFNRERQDFGSTFPVSESGRAVARLLATTPFIALSALFAVLVAWREGFVGGMPVGHPSWSGDHAVHTPAELSQYVALAVLAVAAGASLGRRTARPAAFVAVLVVGWFVVATYWLFSHPVVSPFSIIQSQPLHLYAGDRAAAYWTFPAEWRLQPPGPHSDQWSRLFLSESLAWWHNLWLVGLAVVLVSAALPEGRSRRWVLVLGGIAALVGLGGQIAVIP